jgi:hypothetical protein
MELLLNLVWLTLALPALLLLVRARRFAKDSGQVSCTDAFVIVVCLLVLLFPVVSATDDLLVFGLEVEECNVSKKLVQQSPGPKAPVFGTGMGAPAQLHSAASFAPDNELGKLVSTLTTVVPEYNSVATVGCRPPPALMSTQPSSRL